jgi:hypothetical protein
MPAAGEAIWGGEATIHRHTSAPGNTTHRRGGGGPQMPLSARARRDPQLSLRAIATARRGNLALARPRLAVDKPMAMPGVPCLIQLGLQSARLRKGKGLAVALDNLTLVLNGEVPFELFTKAMENLHALVTALSIEVNSSDVEWTIADLQRSSAMVTIAGSADDLAKVERAVKAYSAVGRSLERGDIIPFPARIRRFADAIVNLTDSRVPSVIFQTPDEDFEVVRPSQDIGLPAPTSGVSAHGAIEGRIQTLTSRRGLRFTLFDSAHDKAVSCYLKEGDEDLIRGMWDSRALVEGIISRDMVTYRPIAIRQIERILPAKEVERGSYRRARGILPRTEGMPLAEQVIRRSRNAE